MTLLDLRDYLNTLSHEELLAETYTIPIFNNGYVVEAHPRCIRFELAETTLCYAPSYGELFVEDDDGLPEDCVTFVTKGKLSISIYDR